MTKDLSPHQIRVNGHEAWYYRNAKSIEVFVRPLDESGNPLIGKPISFRLRAKQVLGVKELSKRGKS